jgi:D-alanyl-lipoteichoic acid acyltransferase DltB (MBOAT superfamily)
MSIPIILLLVVLGIVYWVAIPPVQRKTVLLVVSLIWLYSLQPAVPAPGLTFILPTLLVFAIVCVGWLLQPPARPANHILGTLLLVPGVMAVGLALPETSPLYPIIQDMILNGPGQHLDVILAFACAVSLTYLLIRPFVTMRRALLGLCVLIGFLALANLGLPNDPLSRRLHRFDALGALPQAQLVLLFALAVVGIAPLLIRGVQRDRARRQITALWIVLLVFVLFCLKIQVVKEQITYTLGGGPSLMDWQWLGVSYIAFRLLHVIFDWRDEALDIHFSLPEFVTYVLFFPSLLAGPITRAEEVIPQLALPRFQLRNLYLGSIRIAFGIFKKFALSALLSVIVLSPSSLETHAPHPLILILMLYAALVQLYLDFAGYSDIAIGLGLIYGVVLPENFDRPLLRPNIQIFWQTWHTTLSTWFRQYWFNPLTRRLIKLKHRPPPILIAFIAQTSTMILIGLWHRASLNWALWGAYHGVGLWLYKFIADRNRKSYNAWLKRPGRARLMRVVNTIVTFHYAAIGMSFIAMTTPDEVLRYWVAIFGRVL